MTLLLVSIVQVHQIDRLKAQISLASRKLVLKEAWMHRVDASRNVSISDHTLLFQISEQGRRRDAIVSIVWQVAIL